MMIGYTPNNIGYCQSKSTHYNIVHVCRAIREPSMPAHAHTSHTTHTHTLNRVHCHDIATSGQKVRMQHKRTYIFVCVFGRTMCVCVCSTQPEATFISNVDVSAHVNTRTHTHTYKNTHRHICANPLQKKESNRIGFPIRITCSVSMCTQVKRKYTCTTYT